MPRARRTAASGRSRTASTPASSRTGQAGVGSTPSRHSPASTTVSRRRSARRHQSTSPAPPLATERVTRKKTHAEAWEARQALEGDEDGDLVPPSSDDEYEEWVARKEGRAGTSSQDVEGEEDEEDEDSAGTTDTEAMVSDEETQDALARQRKLRSRQGVGRFLFSSPLSSPPLSVASMPPLDSLPMSSSRETTPTMPLSFSQTLDESLDEPHEPLEVSSDSYETPFKTAPLGELQLLSQDGTALQESLRQTLDAARHGSQEPMPSAAISAGGASPAPAPAPMSTPTRPSSHIADIRDPSFRSPNLEPPSLLKQAVSVSPRISVPPFSFGPRQTGPVTPAKPSQVSSHYLSPLQEGQGHGQALSPLAEQGLADGNDEYDYGLPDTPVPDMTLHPVASSPPVTIGRASDLRPMSESPLSSASLLPPPPALNIGSSEAGPSRRSHPTILSPVRLDDLQPYFQDADMQVAYEAVDPDLERFRTARTFRTRTVLQLQPYTKERQLYEAALRRGGLKKGKHAVASAREITQEDIEDDVRVPSSSSASGQEPERIVIGATPPVPKRREPKPLVQSDYDEYLLRFDRLADLDDEEDQRRLQKIARHRLREEKEARRRRREALHVKKAFERLLRGDEEQEEERPPATPGSGDDDRHGGPRDAQAGKRKAGETRRTDGGEKTYLRRTKPARPAEPPPARVESASESDSDSALPALPPPLSRTVWGDPTASPGVSTRASQAPIQRREQRSTINVTSPESAMMFDISYMGDAMDLNGGDDASPFFVNSHHDRSPAAVDSDASANSTPPDPRAKIARRMLPAAMLQRLEKEAQEKERLRRLRKADEKRRQARLAEPARPGRAVTRRGDGDIEFSELVDGLASDGDDSPDPTPEQGFVSTPAALGQAQLIVISSDDERGLSSGSQAEEDFGLPAGGGAESLAQLYRGDFESIIGGDRMRIQRQQRYRHGLARDRNIGGRGGGARSSRPALGVVKRTKAPVSSRQRDMYQSRLDFPMERSPRDNTAPRKQGKRKSHMESAIRARPAIRLDDDVIFSVDDFAFASPPVDNVERDARSPVSAKKSKHTPAKASARDKPSSKRTSAPSRPFARVRSSTAIEIDQESDADVLDDGVGKAKSWAHFDKFSIDFGFTPLPLGVYCSSRVIADGGLRDLVQSVRGMNAATVPVTQEVNGVTLSPSMPPAEIVDVLDIVFDGIYRDFVAYVNDPNDTSPPILLALRFFARYVSYKRNETNTTALGDKMRTSILALSTRIDDVVQSGARPARPVREVFLTLRWEVFSLAVRLGVATSWTGSATELVRTTSVALTKQLLNIGFDKTVKPLKSILRQESDSAEVKDDSIAAWIGVLQVLGALPTSTSLGMVHVLNIALDQSYSADQIGPIAAERIWYIIFGLCALSQFDEYGRINQTFRATPRWTLLRRAVGLIKIAHNEEAEERAQVEKLRGRDRYIRTIMARCIRLSAVWRWSFDRESFSVATKDLGAIFKDRHHRNLPTEPPVDYPDFITRFDMSMTAAEDARHETAFELYLRLVCVAAADIIGSARTMAEAQQAESDVMRLIMSIIPVTAVKFNRVLPPSARQLGQLVNRYSIAIAACYFVPSLLTYLLSNCRKWAPLEKADFDSRQISIRGLMYLGVAVRHHQQPLEPVVARLADILAALQVERDACGKPDLPAQAPTRLEVERTMVLVVACFRQIILHHSFDPEGQKRVEYPDPCLLHPSWTERVFDLDLAHDLKCGNEIVSTIQAYLGARAAALPRLAKQRREAREIKVESQDEFSLGIDFSTVDLVALGGVAQEVDPIEKLDEAFGQVITTVISPKIYRLLSDMLAPSAEDDLSREQQAERQAFISKLTECWSDCAGVVVVDHNAPDGWAPYIGAFGRESWQRLRDERGRYQVGLHFMLSVAKLDPAAFSVHQEDFVSLFFQSVVTDRLSIEPEYVANLLQLPGAQDHPLLAPLHEHAVLRQSHDMLEFAAARTDALRSIFRALPSILGASTTSAGVKTFAYRCINILVSSLIANLNRIHPAKVLYRETYRAFCDTTVSDLRLSAGQYFNDNSVPSLKAFAM